MSNDIDLAKSIWFIEWHFLSLCLSLSLSPFLYPLPLPFPVPLSVIEEIRTASEECASSCEGGDRVGKFDLIQGNEKSLLNFSFLI